jgi:translation initiation factor IF-3
MYNQRSRPPRPVRLSATAELRQSFLTNDQIKYKHSQVRLHNSDGTIVGVVNVNQALDMASDEGLDLVCTVPNAVPPVCKIVDFGKFIYNEQKRQQEVEKKQRESRVDVKEIQFRPSIDEHDFETKIKKIKEFLEDGDKCKIVIRFRGREMSDTSKGYDIINKIIELIDIAQVEGRPDMNGNRMIATIIKSKRP